MYTLYFVITLAEKQTAHSCTYCRCSLVCERFAGSSVGHFGVITQQPLRNRRANRQCLCRSVSRPISQNRGEEKKVGVTWQKCYYEIAGVYFNSTWPCQGHHCLPGLVETWCYWTKAAAPQRHTQQLFSVATYHLMTHEESKTTCKTSSFREKQLPTASSYTTMAFNTTKKDI